MSTPIRRRLARIGSSSRSNPSRSSASAPMKALPMSVGHLGGRERAESAEARRRLVGHLGEQLVPAAQQARAASAAIVGFDQPSAIISWRTRT